MNLARNCSKLLISGIEADRSAILIKPEMAVQATAFYCPQNIFCTCSLLSF